MTNYFRVFAIILGICFALLIQVLLFHKIRHPTVHLPRKKPTRKAMLVKRL